MTKYGTIKGLLEGAVQGGTLTIPRPSWYCFVIKSLSIGGSATFYSTSVHRQ